MLVNVDHLIVGGGLAGLNAALQLAETGRVLVVTKREVGESATAYAQGGIASVVLKEDSFDSHAADTITAGAGLCHPNVVNSVVADGPRAIERLKALGVTFDCHDGEYDLGREGGHSVRRILHAEDITGREIMRALRERVEANPNVLLWTNHIVIDLITAKKLALSGENRCVGAYVLDPSTAEIKTVRAKCTLLSTGGAGKVYLYTSNPGLATGDGIAMGFRAGATCANMEFFQFHPTCLYHPHAKSFLISEALRGEGGILRRQDGKAFMRERHAMADLAPRDIVARAIDWEMKRSGADYVTLDMTSRDPAFVAARFPNIHTSCLSLGIDMTKVPIPVVPAAHYCCGGVRTDLRAATDVAGLWAAGETACTGLHGANRLASNSLLEAAVFSDRAARDMAAFAGEVGGDLELPEWDSGNAADPDEMVVVSHNWDELRRAMWSYVGIVRSDKRLQRAEARTAFLQDEIHQYYWDFKVVSDLVELRNLATIAELIVACARRRRESRGLHFNADVPDTSDAWRRDTIVRRGPDGTLAFENGALTA